MEKVKDRSLVTNCGIINFPAFFPVTTFGEKFPLDEIVRPYLSRFAPAIMVSYYYAKMMKKRPAVPLFIDSGGFASLFEGAEMIDMGPYCAIKTKEGDVIDPSEVLEFQMANGDIGSTVDFIIPPGLGEQESRRRQDATIRNAIWGVGQPRRKGFRLYASIQVWDSTSAFRIMRELNDYPFDGFALGGMVPRIGKPESILQIVQGIREIEQKRPLHLFGIGQPKLIRQLFDEGVDSVDSSSYLRYSVEKMYLDPFTVEYQKLESTDPLQDTCGCQICKSLGKKYLALGGELNTMTLALHNLSVLTQFNNQT